MDFIKLESAKVILKFETAKILEMFAVSNLTLEEIVILSEKIKHIPYNNDILFYLSELGNEKMYTLVLAIKNDNEALFYWQKFKKYNDTIIVLKNFVPILLDRRIVISEETAILFVILLTRLSHL